MIALLYLSVPFLCVAVAFYFIGWFCGHFKGCRETEARWMKSFNRNYDGALEGKLVIEEPLDIPEFLRKKSAEARPALAEIRKNEYLKESAHKAVHGLEGKMIECDPLDIPAFLRKKNDEQILCANGCIMVNGECFVDDPDARTPEGHRIFADHVTKGLKVVITYA